MLKKTLAALLALLLAVSGLSTLALADSLSECFTPNLMANTYNNACDVLMKHFGEDMTQEEKDGIAADMKISLLSSEDAGVVYASSTGHVMLTALYEGQSADPDQPATYWGIVVDAPEEQFAILVGMALTAAFTVHDKSVDGVELMRWVQNNLRDGAQYKFNGFYMEIEKSEDSWIYFVYPDSLEDNAPTDSVESGSENVGGGENDVLIEWDGMSAQLLRAELRHYSNGDASIRLVCRFVNHTDRDIWLKMDNAKLDGVPVDSAGESDILAGMDSGADSSEYLLLKPEDSSDSAIAAFQAPETATFTLTVKDNDTYEDLAVKDVTLSLSDWLVEP